MVKFLCTFSLLTVFCFYAKARCGGGSANGMLKERFTGCDSGFLDRLTNHPEIYKAVLDSCVNGGCSLFLTPECREVYKSALSEHESLIATTAKQYNCKDSGPYNSNSNASSSSPNDHCKWVSRRTVDLHCGGGDKSTNICGVGGRAVCAGEVVCNKQFGVSDGKTKKLEPYPPGIYSLSCLSRTGRCQNISMDECMSDRHTSIYDEEIHYHQSIRPAIEKIRPKNTRSVQ